MAGQNLQCRQPTETLQNLVAACALLSGCNGLETMQFRKGFCAFKPAGISWLGVQAASAWQLNVANLARSAVLLDTSLPS